MTETPFGGQIAHLSEEVRLLFAAGLASLAQDMTDRHPLLVRLSGMRASLLAETFLTNVPSHVSFDEPELQEMISYLPGSQYWTIFWEFDEQRDGFYSLVGEVAVDGDVVSFDLGSGLQGSTDFVLAPEDARLVECVRDYVRLWHPSTTDELSVSVVEVPVTWDLLEDMSRNGAALEAYLDTITSPAGVSGIMTRGLRAAPHSDLALVETGYAGATTIAVDTRRKLEALAEVVAAHTLSLHAPRLPTA